MENLPQNPPTQDNLLEELLAGAAKRAAEQQMTELAQKGTVTKAEFSTALNEFQRNLLDQLTSVIDQKLQKAAPTPAESSEEAETHAEPVQKAGQTTGSGRRSTVSNSANLRDDNPLAYIIQKSRANKGELDDQDKALLWGLTHRGLSHGMSYDGIDGEDFGDEYAN